MHALRTRAVRGRPRTSPAVTEGSRLVTLGVFYAVVGLWVAFGATALVRPDMLDSLWAEFVRLPFLVRGPAGLLFLPWVAALAIRASTNLELWLQLAIVAGLVVMSVSLVLPRRPRTDEPRPVS